MTQTAQPAPKDGKTRSLQAVLAWRLGGVLVVSMSLVIITLLSYFWIALDDLDDASLQVQAQQIVGSLSKSGGRISLKLPNALTRTYRDSGDGFLYAIKDSLGQIVFASSAKARQLIAPVLPSQAMPFFFRLPNASGGESPYYTLAIAVPDFPGHILYVAQGQIHGDVYFDTIITEFAEHIGWILPVMLFAALASRIGPHSTDIRLPLLNIPNEVRPLVEAINDALDRLEKGFLLQRQFTANAAHELRTPLAILNARLDEMNDSETAASLAVDIQRMNRLVEQLLRVSRLDAQDMAMDDDIDLNAIAAEIVGYLAPLAIAAGQTLSLSPAEGPVMVRGNKGALSDALRNLLENAMQHSPRDGEIMVEVSAGGTIAVSDHGAGVSEADRPHIFERFWRGRERSETGSGLGLAIVSETAAAHGGTVIVANNPGAGASFTIRLPLKPSATL